MNRVIGYVIAIATAIMTYFAFYGISSFFGSENPHFIASALTIAMIIHESAHLIAFEVNKIPAMMLFLVILGGARPLPKYDSKFKQLPWERQAIIMLAGVIGNFAVILGAYLCSQYNYLTYNDFLRISNMNGLLILWNLFPLWIYDGGRFAKLFFDSVSEDSDMKYAIVLGAIFIGVLITLSIIWGKFEFIYVWLFLFGIQHKATRDDPYGSENPKAIPKSHQKWWAALYLLIISGGAIIVYVTPYWL